MKKVFIFIVLIIIGIFAFFFYENNIEEERLTDLLETIEDEFIIDNYYIFGTHFSIEGCIQKNLDSIELVLKNKENEKVLNSNIDYKENKTCFYISDKLNTGINLDELTIGEYLLFIKENDTYYTLKNNTSYEDLEYYTITKDNKNNKINIIFDEFDSKNFVKFIVKEKKLPKSVYDISIDPGHGGKDTGASGKLNGKVYYESNLTLEIAMLLKEKLEDKGLKVKLTRDSDTFLSNYDKGGRAVIPNEFNTKYSISLHLNSSSGIQNYGGVEVYTPNDIDLSFATLLSDNLKEIVGYSKKSINSISNGVYFTYFDSNDIKDARKSFIEKDMIPYDIKLGAPYMFMIREVGGVLTHAYVDGRNDYYGINPYYNSNHVSEPYLVEMAYMNYASDLEKVVKNKEKFADALANSIFEYLNIS